MHDEIAHVRVVHRSLRHPPPGLVGLRVVRIDADDVEFAQIGKFDVLKRLELPTEHEVQELLGGPARGVCRAHGRSLHWSVGGGDLARHRIASNVSFTLAFKRFGSLLWLGESKVAKDGCSGASMPACWRGMLV